MKKNSKLYLLIFLGLLSALGRFITDLYMPAVPELSNYYSVSVTTVQFTLTGAMLGLGLGQLFIGPISDKFGRKKPLVVSISIYILVTLAIVVSKNIYFVIFLRSLQGFAASGSVVISRAVAADLYSGKKLSKFFSMMMIVNGVGPVIAPIVGGVLLDFFNWQSIFIVLALLGLTLLAFAFMFKESLTIERRNNDKLGKVYFSIFNMLKDFSFIRYVLLQSFTMAALFTYVSASPFIFQKNYGVSSFVYSLIFGANGIAIILGTLISVRLGAKKSLFVALRIMFVTSILLALAFFYVNNMYLVQFLFFILSFGAGAVFPSASSLAMNKGKENAGAASALLGFISFAFGGLVSPIIGLANIYVTTSLVIFVATSVQLLIYSNRNKKLGGTKFEKK